MKRNAMRLRIDASGPVMRDLKHRRNIAANTPTQSTQASDVYWMTALCILGEEGVSLAVPDMWADSGVMFPEAKPWALNGGPGPGGQPLLSFATNCVHDSLWGDTAPGHHLEATMKVCYRRCTAVPLDCRLEADVPYRIDFKVGPHQGLLTDWNKVAAKFGMEPMPTR